jgi:hypothetical protein
MTEERALQLCLAIAASSALGVSTRVTKPAGNALASKWDGFASLSYSMRLNELI